MLRSVKVELWEEEVTPGSGIRKRKKWHFVGPPTRNKMQTGEQVEVGQQKVPLWWWVFSGQDDKRVNGTVALSALRRIADSGRVWNGNSLKWQNKEIGCYFIDLWSHSITVQLLNLHLVGHHTGLWECNVWTFKKLRIQWGGRCVRGRHMCE